MRKFAFILLPMLLGLAGCGSQSLTCPKPRLHAPASAPVEAAVRLDAIRARFDNGYSTNDLNETIAALRRSYSDADDDAIYNYLVAAYCPLAANSGVSISAQRARLLSFENAAHAVLGS